MLSDEWTMGGGKGILKSRKQWPSYRKWKVRNGYINAASILPPFFSALIIIFITLMYVFLSFQSHILTLLTGSKWLVTESTLTCSCITWPPNFRFIMILPVKPSLREREQGLMDCLMQYGPPFKVTTRYCYWCDTAGAVGIQLSTLTLSIKIYSSIHFRVDAGMILLFHRSLDLLSKCQVRCLRSGGVRSLHITTCWVHVLWGTPYISTFCSSSR